MREHPSSGERTGAASKPQWCQAGARCHWGVAGSSRMLVPERRFVNGDSRRVWNGPLQMVTVQ